MKSVVIYYSLTGKTKEIAIHLAKELQCDVAEITETKKRSIFGAYVLGSFAAMRNKASNITPLNLDISRYDTIVLATPVWASSPVPAINAFVESNNLKGKQVILVICPASGDDSKTAAKLTAKLESKGCTVKMHHGFKTSGLVEADIAKKAEDIAKLYR